MLYLILEIHANASIQEGLHHICTPIDHGIMQWSVSFLWYPNRLNKERGCV